MRIPAVSFQWPQAARSRASNLPAKHASPAAKPRSFPLRPLSNKLLHRIVLAILPALLLAGILVAAVFGDNGMNVRWRLGQDLRVHNEALASVERDNQRLLRELNLADRDPVIIERMVAEELGWGQEGATLYRFE